MHSYLFICKSILLHKVLQYMLLIDIHDSVMDM
jgi:hypothetical protein